MKKFLFLLIIFSIGIVLAYTPQSYDSVDLVYGGSYTPPAYDSVDLIYGEVVTECNPTLNEDWDISDAQVCDGVERTIGTGTINILSGGNLTLINGANVSSSGLELQTTGDQVFINSGSEIRLS